MADLVLRLELDGRIVGEWQLDGQELRLTVADRAGRQVAALTTMLPAPAADTLRTPLGQPVDELDEDTRISTAAGLEATAEALGQERTQTQPLSGLTAGSLEEELRLLGVRTDGSLERLPGDDFTLPLPEPTAGTTEDSLGDRDSFHPVGVAEQSTTRPNLARLARDQAAHKDSGVLEVWFYKGGRWTRRGWLSPGQRASLRGGVIRCIKDGTLFVSPGRWFSASAILPDGEQVQIGPGEEPLKLPMGSAVTLWDGERGLHVRTAENSEPGRLRVH